MKKLIIALGCIAAITTFASCTADNVNDSVSSNPKSNNLYSRTIVIDTTGGDDGTGVKH